MGQPPQAPQGMPPQGQQPQGARPNNVPPMMGQQPQAPQGQQLQSNDGQNIQPQPEKKEDLKAETEDKTETNGSQPSSPQIATMMGGLAGQLGEKPIPHLIRKKTGEVINITKPEFAIGKSQSNADYTIEENPAISRVHCIIVQKNGVNYIKDNNSTNHTYINDEELEPGKEVLLKHKTVIRMGDEEFTFLLRKE